MHWGYDVIKLKGRGIGGCNILMRGLMSPGKVSSVPEEIGLLTLVFHFCNKNNFHILDDLKLSNGFYGVVDVVVDFVRSAWRDSTPRRSKSPA